MSHNQNPYKNYQFFQGDIHNHCNLSYGHGSFAEAIKNAKTQLDFTSVTLHAAWPDMPREDPDLDYLIAYHEYGFREASNNWEDYLKQVDLANQEGRFVTFPSYEWHSSEFGDHCIYFKSPQNQPILTSSSPHALKKELLRLNSPCFMIPHHIGYKQGYRGINWDSFSATLSPVVEIFSFHGASERAEGPYPYLHSMGPRHARSCAQYGWEKGQIFGVIGSTDHHNAFPGSYGSGRMGVWAESLSRDGLWEAIKHRRTVALTGDRIQLKFSLNGHPMGAVCPPTEARHIHVEIVGDDRIDSIDLLHNNKIIHRECPEENSAKSGRFKCLLELGWGEKPADTTWQCQIKVSQGKIHHVEPHFRGNNDQELPEGDDFAYAALDLISPQILHFSTQTRPNPTFQTPATEGVVLELEGGINTIIEADINGQTYRHSLGELMMGSQTHYRGGFVSPALCFHKAVPQSEYDLTFDLTHLSISKIRDWYYVRVRQNNGQMAWSSPIWVEKYSSN